MAVGSPTGVDLESDWGRSGFLMYRMGHYVSTHVVTKVVLLWLSEKLKL